MTTGIALSAGHEPNAQGAEYNGITEYALASEWIKEIAAKLRETIPCDIVPTGDLQSKIGWINVRDYRLAIELHFNSDTTKKQTGSETLYCPGSAKGMVLAKIVQVYLGPLFPPSRGAKPGWYQGDPKKGPLYFLSNTGPWALILEPEFIYNYEMLAEKKFAAIEMIADGIAEAYAASA